MRNLVLCKDVVSDTDKMNVLPQFRGSFLVFPLPCQSSLSMAYTTWIRYTVVAGGGVGNSPWEEGPSRYTGYY